MLTAAQSLAFYFIRSLIHRPAVCFAQPHIASPSILALSDSSKHMIQILQLLDERRMSLSFCISRKELVFLAGLGLLWQNIGLKRDSKLAKESQKLLSAVIDQLESESSHAAAEFSVIANLLLSIDGGKRDASSTSPRAQEMPAPSPKPKSPKRQVQPLKSRASISATPGQPAKVEPQQPPSRRATVSSASPPASQRHIRSPSGSSLPSTLPEPVSASQPPSEKPKSADTSMDYNLDYFSLGNNLRAVSCPDISKTEISTADWEFVLSDMDRGHSNIFNGIYGGKECGDDNSPFAALTAEFHQQHPSSSLSVSNDVHGLSPEAWSASSGDLSQNQGTAAQSVLSYSEESLGSADDAGTLNDINLNQDNVNLMDPFKGIMIPAADDDIDDFGLVDGWDRRQVV